MAIVWKMSSLCNNEKLFGIDSRTPPFRERKKIQYNDQFKTNSDLEVITCTNVYFLW